MSAKNPVIFMIAGEPSGDLLGSALMAAIKAETCQEILFCGVGGEKMTAEGVKSLFPMNEISLMGLFELLPHMRNILRRINQTVGEIRRVRPDIIITIDSPGFCLSVLRRLKDLPTPRVHYVAPSIWAWRPGRIQKFLGTVNHLLCLLPFEPKLFREKGLEATFVGHPVMERLIDKADGSAFRALYNIAQDVPLIGIFPGSRKGEVRRHLPIFRDTVHRLLGKHQSLQAIIPTVAAVSDIIQEDLKSWGLPVITVEKQDEIYPGMAACNVALAASGTVTLELSRAEVPLVVAYKTNIFTALLAKKLAKVRFVNICNIMENEEIIPERLLSKCRPDLLADDLHSLMSDPVAAQNQILRATNTLKGLIPFTGTPSQQAAKVVLKQLIMNPKAS